MKQINNNLVSMWLNQTDDIDYSIYTTCFSVACHPTAMKCKPSAICHLKYHTQLDKVTNLICRYNIIEDNLTKTSLVPQFCLTTWLILERLLHIVINPLLYSRHSVHEFRCDEYEHSPSSNYHLCCSGHYCNYDAFQWI